MSKFEERLNFLKFTVVFSGLVAGAYALLILAGWIVADRTLMFNYQVARFHREVIDGKVLDFSKTDIVIVGDSTAARALLPNIIGPKDAVGLAVNGGSAIETYYALEHYFETGARPSCVVLMTSYGAYQVHQDSKFWQYTVPTRMVLSSDVEDFLSVTRDLGLVPGRGTVPGWGRVRAWQSSRPPTPIGVVFIFGYSILIWPGCIRSEFTEWCATSAVRPQCR